MNNYVEDIIRQADEEQRRRILDGMNGYGLAMERARERRERRALWSAIGFALAFTVALAGISWFCTWLFTSRTGQMILNSILGS